MPFGEEIQAGVAGRDNHFGRQDFVKQMFTGQERDAETNLDFFQARYMSAPQGRFLSADPFNAGADPMDPQSWNGYSYVRNSPLNAIDPTGMTCLYDDDGNITGDNGDGLGCGSGGSVTVPGGPPDPVPVDPCFYCGYIPGNPPGGSGQQPPPPQKPIIIGPTKTGTCPVPPFGPINYSAAADANSKLNILSLIPQFLNGGKQDYKGRPEFGNLQNREAVGNFAFGATGAARGWTFSQTMMYAGVGAVVSNASTQFRGALAQSANMQGQYGGSTNVVPHGMPASTLGPGFPGFPVIAPNGIPTQGDQVGWNENAAVANGFIWQSNGCHQ